MTERSISDATGKPIVDTAAQWRAAGITARKLRSLTSSGDLVRVRHGVYATKSAVKWAMNDPRRGHALRVMAVMLSSGRDSVASHHSAALIHGLDLLRPAPRDVVTLTRPSSRRTHRLESEGVVCHVAALPAEHVTRRWGVSVTTPARTVVDLARRLPFADAVTAADSALHLGKTTKPELQQVVDSCARWPGVDRARRTVAFSDSRAESPLESCARVIFSRFGLEAAQLQFTVRGPGFVFRGDFYWARYRTIAEADGMAKYKDPERAREQLRRDRLLRDAGYKVVHFTWRELFETPGVVVARIRKAFAAHTAF